MTAYRLAALRDLLRLFFPERCCSCGNDLVGDEHDICTHCLSHLPLTQYSAADNNATEQRLMGRVPYIAATSFLYFRKSGIAQSIVHHIKYYGHEQLGRTMGALMGKDLQCSGRFDTVDVIVPIPLHRRKQRQRGYNQAHLLCQGIAASFPRPVISGQLVRRVHTESQTDKDRIGRMENMSHAFEVRNPAAFEGKHVLLVDDVITTGATIAECADTLLSIPGCRVSIATLTIAVS